MAPGGRPVSRGDRPVAPGGRPSSSGARPSTPSPRSLVPEERTPTPDTQSRRAPGAPEAELHNLIWGRQVVLEALRARRPIEKVILKKGIRTVGPVAEILSLAESRNVRFEWADDRTFQSVPGNHQGVLARVRPYHYAQVDEMLALAEEKGELPLLLLLDSVQDPQNFGALLRTAEVVGVHGVIIPEHRAVGVTPVVEKTSAGATEHLRIAQVTNLSRVIEQLKERGVWVVAVDMDAPHAYDEADYRMPMALVLGSEGAGIGRLVRSRCDLAISLPMHGRVQSLNVAIAGSIVLYHASRQRAKSAQSAPSESDQ